MNVEDKREKGDSTGNISFSMPGPENSSAYSDQWESGELILLWGIDNGYKGRGKAVEQWS